MDCMIALCVLNPMKQVSWKKYWSQVKLWPFLCSWVDTFVFREICIFSINLYVSEQILSLITKVYMLQLYKHCISTWSQKPTFSSGLKNRKLEKKSLSPHFGYYWKMKFYCKINGLFSHIRSHMVLVVSFEIPLDRLVWSISLRSEVWTCYETHLSIISPVVFACIGQCCLYSYSKQLQIYHAGSYHAIS